jgi:hypothetical protein
MTTTPLPRTGAMALRWYSDIGRVPEASARRPATAPTVAQELSTLINAPTEYSSAGGGRGTQPVAAAEKRLGHYVGQLGR